MKHIKTLVGIITLSLGIGVLYTDAAFAAPITNSSQCTAAGGSWLPRNVANDADGANQQSYNRDVCLVNNKVVTSTEQAEAEKTAGQSGGANTGEGCGGVETAIIKCGATGEGTDVKNTGVWGLLLLVINILTAGVGVAALGGLIYGGVLYTSSGGNPEQVKKARTIFTNVVIGIIAFAGMYALLQFLIPGGVFEVPGGSS